MDQVLNEFYENESEILVSKMTDEFDVKIGQLELMYKMQDDSAIFEDRTVASRVQVTRNGRKFYESIFHLPSDLGKEVIRITVTTPNEECCELYGLFINVEFDQ